MKVVPLRNYKRYPNNLPNMAKMLVERLFTPDERSNCNWSSAKGKGKLDPLKLAKAKKYGGSIF